MSGLHSLISTEPTAILTSTVAKERLKVGMAIKEEQVESSLTMLQEFDFCYKLNQIDNAVYGEGNTDMYMFPSLRTRNGEFAISRVMRTMGIKAVNINSDSSKSTIGSYFFARFQVATRKIHEPQRPLYANVFRLQREAEVATVWLNDAQDEIHIVIQGKEKKVSNKNRA